MRRATWDMAVLCLDEYERGEIKLSRLIDYIKNRGGWSIWFTVFKDYKEVREALVNKFPGTSRECFDENFNPVPRHPENTDDPI